MHKFHGILCERIRSKAKTGITDGPVSAGLIRSTSDPALQRAVFRPRDTSLKGKERERRDVFSQYAGARVSIGGRTRTTSQDEEPFRSPRLSRPSWVDWGRIAGAVGIAPGDRAPRPIDRRTFRCGSPMRRGPPFLFRVAGAETSI